MKFNGITIVFIGGQIFNWFYGTKSTNRATATSTQSLHQMLHQCSSLVHVLIRSDTWQTIGWGGGSHLIFVTRFPNHRFHLLHWKGIYCSSRLKLVLSSLLYPGRSLLSDLAGGRPPFSSSGPLQAERCWVDGGAEVQTGWVLKLPHDGEGRRHTSN